MKSFPPVLIRYFDFTIILHVQIQIYAAGTFTIGINVEPDTVIFLPVFATGVKGSHGGSPAYSPVEKFTKYCGSS